MAVYKCRRCGHVQDDPWDEACPGCSGLYRPQKIGPDSAEQKGRSSLAAAVGYATVRIPTGVEGFDKTTGGGLVPGTATLIGGGHSAGKTTLLVAVLDGVAKEKGSALYATSEEGVEGIVSVGTRLGLKNDDVEVLGDQTEIESVLEHARKTKPFCVAVDSLQKYVSVTAGGMPGSIAQAKAVVDAVRGYCRETKRCAIIVNQLDKAGEFKGSTDAVHDVDVVLVLGFVRSDDEDAPDEDDLDDKDDNPVRILYCDKHRRGPGPKTYWYMTRSGVFKCVPPRSKLIALPTAREKYKKDPWADEEV